MESSGDSGEAGRIFGPELPLGKLAKVAQVISGLARIQGSQSESTGPSNHGILPHVCQVLRIISGPPHMLSKLELVREAATVAHVNQYRCRCDSSGAPSG